MAIQEEEITPEIASALLDKNIKNRNIRKDHVLSLAKQMTEGNWQDNGQTIVIDINGCLIDGQHRLSAVVYADIPILMQVMRNAAPEVINTIDTGIARRASDVFSINGIKHPTHVATVALNMMAWDAKRIHKAKNNLPWRGIAKPSHDVVYQYYLQREEDYQWAVTSVLNGRLSDCGIATAGTALMILTRKYQQGSINDFIKKSQIGGDYEMSPTNFLGRWVLNRKTKEARLSKEDKTHRYEQLYAILHCFEKWMANETLQKLQLDSLLVKADYFYSTYADQPKVVVDPMNPPKLEIVG